MFGFLMLLSVAFITLLERHILGLSQERLGPSKNFVFGVFQPFADALKLLQKLVVIPNSSVKFMYWFAPIFFFFVFFLQFPLFQGDIMIWGLNSSLLYLMCVIGLSVFSHFFIGFFSVSKYSMLGSQRALIQSLSYEVVFFLMMFMLMILFQSYCSFSTTNIILYFFFLVFFILILVEVGRAPFDFTEGESELVSGYNLEYSSVMFVFLFLGEYGMMLTFSVFFSSVLFNWNIFYFFPFPSLVVLLVLLIRSAYPRYRFDLMMSLFWFLLLPFVMQMLLVFMSVFIV